MKVASDTFSLPEGINPDWKIGIVHSVYYQDELSGLLSGAEKCLREAGVTGISYHPVLGSFEIPLVGEELAASGSVDAMIGFGIIVQGQTMHADHLAREVTRAMMDIQVRHRIPFGYEVMHVHNMDQVRERSTEQDNRGREAAMAVLYSLAELKRMRS